MMKMQFPNKDNESEQIQNGEQHEAEGAVGAIQPDPAADAPIQPDAVEEAEETALDAPPAPPVPEGGSEQQKPKGVLHHLAYLGNGIWTDAKGKCWCREKKGNTVSSVTMPAEELESRPDIKFMIKYGAIKDTIV